jgi:hypothetical protein
MHFVPYLFIATIVGLCVRRVAARGPILVALLVGSAVSAVQYDAFFGPNFRTSFHEVSFGWNSADAARKRNFDELAGLIPPDARVAAGEHEGPHLARRRVLRSIKEGIEGCDFAIYSERSLRWGGEEHVKPALDAGRFRLRARRGDITLLQAVRPGAG